ncbi:hypothetical protein [Companilactobacillus furfuricola]|uniref:hypothetical protein n=1 Tax=Companilactobacillus furfuricola TaxID=1462575 RepID=UPI0013DDDDE9|nr:hypothetical protein [Companilactobacillus furfuricola]
MKQSFSTFSKNENNLIKKPESVRFKKKDEVIFLAKASLTIKNTLTTITSPRSGNEPPSPTIFRKFDDNIMTMIIF